MTVIFRGIEEREAGLEGASERDSYLQIIDEDIFQRHVMILVVSNG
jgi:hypothetical protein